VRVIEYLNAKEPVCKPTVDWWIVLLCLGSVATVLSSTVKRLQGISTSLFQHEAELKKLCANLSEIFKVEGPLSAVQLEAVDSATCLYIGIMEVAATRDSNNRSYTDALPPVLPHNLATIRTNEVCEIMQPHRDRVEQAGWMAAQMDEIEEDHRELRRAVSSESPFKASLHECSDSSTSLMEVWVLRRNSF